MKIGIASPLDLNIIQSAFSKSDQLDIADIKGLGGSQPSQYALWLLQAGHEVYLYTTSVSVPRGEERVYTSERICLKIGHRPGPLARLLTFQYGEILTIRAMINSDELDIIHAQWCYEFAMAAIKSRFPHIITVRDWPPKILLLTRHPYRLMRLFLSLLVFFNGRDFIANSPYLHRKLKFLASRVRGVIPNGMPDNLLMDKVKRFNAGKLVLIAINNGSGSIKNTRKLLEAFSLLQVDNLNLHLKLIGKGHEPGKDLWSWARDRNLLFNVEFIGPLNFDSVLNELDNADLMVHPSLEESFGNIIVEAMSRGVPVIAGRSSGAVPWVVGDAGLLVDVLSEKSIAEAIRTFYADRALLERYSVAGLQNVTSRFSMSAIEKSYTNHYHRLISKSLS